MGHRFECEARIGPANVNPSDRHSRRCEPLSNEENYSKRFLNDPMFEIKNAKRSENHKTEKREQSVAPFHERDLGAQPPDCQSRSGKALVDLDNRRQSAPIWRGRSCSLFATAGESIPVAQRKRMKTAMPPCSRALRFTTSSTVIILAVDSAPAVRMSVYQRDRWGIRKSVISIRARDALCIRISPALTRPLPPANSSATPLLNKLLPLRAVIVSTYSGWSPMAASTAITIT